MKTTVNENWDASGSIHQILKRINQLVVSQERIVLSHLIKECKASGTLSTLIKRRNLLTPVEGKIKCFTWTEHNGKARELAETELHKLAAVLGEETRDLKTESRLRVESNKRTEAKLAKIYQPIKGRNTTQIGSHRQEVCKTTTAVSKHQPAIPTISLDALLIIGTFEFPSPSVVHLFGADYPKVVKVTVSTCDFAEYLHLALTFDHNRTETIKALVEEKYRMIENNVISFGLNKI